MNVELSKQTKKSNSVNLVTDLLKHFNIKDCFVKLPLLDIEFSAMDSTTKRKPGRIAKIKADSTPASTPTSNTKATSTTTPATTATATPSEKIIGKKQAAAAKKNAATPVQDVVIPTSGGRSRRTPKPNPRYMNDTVVNTTKVSIKDDSADSETADEDLDEILSSDEYRGPTDLPPKKRGIHKSAQKFNKITAKKQVATSSTVGYAGRKGSGSVPAKRKLTDTDIDIDDDHGKQLFLAAKRRLTHSPSNSEDDFENSKKAKSNSPSTDTSALAAKLRAKYGDNLPGKRNNNIKVTSINSKANHRNSIRLTDKGKGSVKLTRASKRSGNQEDFEQMPTFTIVNINDIMSQKEGEEIVIKKRQKADDTETSEDDECNIKSASDQESSPKNVNNRRKTQHTKILSDDKVIRTTRRTVIPTAKMTKSPLTQNRLSQGKATPSPKTFQTSPQLVRAGNNNGRFKNGSNKPAILRPPPPRILNSTLCKPSNKSTVPSLVTKLVTKNDYESEIVTKQNNNTISSRSKENNVTSYTYTEKDGKLIPKKQPIQRKAVLPIVRQQTTIQQRINTMQQSNLTQKRMKKITCFETWYVIKMVEPKPKLEKATVGLSLIEIGNDIKEIELPSSEWSYKIILEPLNKDQLTSKTTKATNKLNKADNKSSKTDDEKDVSNDSQDSSTQSEELLYTGEVQDPSIDPNERHKYHPINIMFRRKCQNTKIRIQFDRTVIFKNQTFYLNVDGKNIKLLGAPLNIDSHDDIKILLQIVNDISLNSCCVELTSHIL